MVDSHKYTGGIVVAILIFLGTAVLEGFINLWLFKKYGGCPMVEKHAKAK